MMYADEVHLFFRHKNKATLQDQINIAMSKILDRLKANYLTVNTDKTFMQTYTNRKSAEPINIYINGSVAKEVKTIKYLGVLVDSDQSLYLTLPLFAIQ